MAQVRARAWARALLRQQTTRLKLLPTIPKMKRAARRLVTMTRMPTVTMTTMTTMRMTVQLRRLPCEHGHAATAGLSLAMTARSPLASLQRQRAGQQGQDLPGASVMGGGHCETSAQATAVIVQADRHPLHVHVRLRLRLRLRASERPSIAPLVEVKAAAPAAAARGVKAMAALTMQPVLLGRRGLGLGLAVALALCRTRRRRHQQRPRQVVAAQGQAQTQLHGLLAI